MTSPGQASTGEATMWAHIDAHFAGRISPTAERAVRAHLPDCASCRDRYERHLLLEELDPRALGAVARLGRGLDIGPGRMSFFRWLIAGGSVALAAAAALIVLVTPPRNIRPTEFVSRGAAMSAAAAPALRIYQIPRGEKPSLVAADQEIPRDAELAFAYRNPGAAQRILIFAVDEHRHIYWYHPGWSDVTMNPVAVNISPGPGWHELPAAVSHAFDGSHLRVVALFTARPVAVREIEQALQQRRDGAPLVDGAAEVNVVLKVIP